MGLFGAAHIWRGDGGGSKKTPHPKICDARLIKLGTVILYLKKIQKAYKSRDTPLECC